MSTRETGLPVLENSCFGRAGGPTREGQEDSSKRARSGLRAWRATRLPWIRFGLLALLVAWAASVDIAFDPYALATRFVLAFMLIAQFRLWDDLADRARDRIEHPNRVLARIENVRAFVVACAVLGATNALALHACGGPATVAGLALLSSAVGAWYRFHTGRSAVHAHVLLLKYPVFVFLLASPFAAASTLALAAVSVYSAICAFELLDASGAKRGCSRLLAAHGGALTIAASAQGVDAIGIAAGLIVATIQAGVWLGEGACFSGARRKYWPFIAAVVVLVRISLGGNT